MAISTGLSFKFRESGSSRFRATVIATRGAARHPGREVHCGARYDSVPPFALRLARIEVVAPA